MHSDDMTILRQQPDPDRVGWSSKTGRESDRTNHRPIFSPNLATHTLTAHPMLSFRETGTYNLQVTGLVLESEAHESKAKTN